MSPTRRSRLAASPGRRAQQRGAVAIVVGLAMAVLVGFIGLAIDGGHLYLTKTELQNGADACALAASYELAGVPEVPVAAFERAEAAGKAVATQNKVGFQGAAIPAGTVSVGFGSSLAAGSSWVGAMGAPADSKYVRCTITRSGILPWFMQVMGIGAQTVSSFATATLTPAQTNCAVPMALCVRGPAPSFGYTPGDWIPMGYAEGDPLTGNFRWIDYTPPSGGASELANLMRGAGQCSLPEPIPGSCVGAPNGTPGCVGQTGAMNSMEDAYNSRFGVYKPGGGTSLTSSVPDFTGYSYSTENWTLGRNAYAGTVGGIPNFREARSLHEPANTGDPNVTPRFYSAPYQASTQAQHTAYGADRRLVVMPIVDCTDFASSQTAAVRAYACVLLLDTYRRTGNVVETRVEYIGRSNEPGSPCATSGIAGIATSLGPMVPALVQ